MRCWKDDLKNIDVNVECEQCGQFAVAADVVAESQRLLADGCPGSSYECPPRLFARLLDPATVESLEGAGRPLSLPEPPLRGEASHHDRLRVTVSVHGAARGGIERRAIARWEDDGGRVQLPRVRRA